MTKVFIIIEPDPIVCMDLEGALLDVYPDARVVAGASLRAVGSVVDQRGPETTWIVRNTEITSNGDLLRVVRSAEVCGSHIVTIGDVDGFDRPAAVIDTPFTTKMLLAALGQPASDAV